MKKLMFLFAFIMFTFLSCSDNENANSQNSAQIVNTKINEVLKEKNIISQKIMYNLLSKEDKFKIWNDRLTKIIHNDKLTEQQLNLLNDLKSQLSVSLFNNDSMNDNREIFKNVYIKTFLKKSIAVFSEEFIYNNFYTLSNKSNDQIISREIVLENNIVGPKSKCTCNIGSIWSCSGLGTCRRSDCEPTQNWGGCGFLMFFDCNGKCFIYY
ncbi:hypothetical protein B0A58_03540 [Flavobacterium branchiophilum NBRC 15030 = ATCC 35035]|uniref:Lipoprotein n=1 Tax=Flavobacterium branchiophilum TaxID=55197 RepID=A0A543G2J6_9FLAO|nr:bacteriocin fulvocin C-related protein [Flavobacterium branchiophilum]OXA79200.1 hypothetical protein B0A58_03540 [Flavobacterium branchiophilum NBRC 15030 = ATCC 35035]TQM40316.1 hypothetical protein BC670_1197 [Flavobacterium branchiophilum]GEM54013.1 hypothetical protein FB1_02340 [Flavobacterium branchiophilum NBRC 15030 = ATCC 35035]